MVLTGVFCGDPVGQPVMHYGHGYIFFVEQGDPKFGEVVPDLDLVFPFTTADGFNWVGYGLPGDSGSEVMNVAGLAVGDLTHGLAPGRRPRPGDQLRHRHGRDLQPDRLEKATRL